VLKTLTFSVVAKKSRTFSSFSYSANEQRMLPPSAGAGSPAGQWKYSMPWTSCSV